MKKHFAISVLGLLIFAGFSSCNRGSGCPAAQAMQQTASMSPGEMMAAQKKSKKAAANKSSVLPSEVKYKGGKKSKKGCK